ncbi:YrbL family protein [Psychrobacter lutiphocae]|uniref:YrbL family protein n=1 Tax=Psychrobacter lutiphocae TaxID=540500 RepID=UPI0003607BBE|nr:YrbL family protein [Psychrobacter lutiphocae]
MIVVENLDLLGKGTQKLVYAYPEDDGKVIKIMRPENATADGGRATQHHLRSHRHQGIYRQFRRELLQYLQLCKNHYSQNQYIFPIETVHGFIGTNQGLGLVTEKIISPTGQSLTLEHLLIKGLYGDEQQQALARFFDDCCDFHVVFGEINIGGIMYTEQRQGRPEFVLVDGIGEKLLIPFRSMSKSINTKNIRKVEQRIYQDIIEYQTKLKIKKNSLF